MSRLTVGFLLFPGFDTLDVTGPAELFGVPVLNDKFSLLFITQDGQQATSALGLKTVPDHSFETCPVLDVLLVPGQSPATVLMQHLLHSKSYTGWTGQPVQLSFATLLKLSRRPRGKEASE